MKTNKKTKKFIKGLMDNIAGFVAYYWKPVLGYSVMVVFVLLGGVVSFWLGKTLRWYGLILVIPVSIVLGFLGGTLGGMIRNS